MGDILKTVRIGETLKVKYEITLVSMVTSEEWALKAMEALDFSARQLDYQCECLIICPQDFEVGNRKWIKKQIDQTLTWKDYSPWILKNLHKYIKTDFCITIQYDGFIIDPTFWTDNFLKTDYIGALWPNISQVNRVGNGGFSFRSKKFLDLSSQIEYKVGKHNGEDWVACVEQYDYMLKNGVNFADKILARQFSVEHIVDGCFYDKNKLETYKSFGFHDRSNIAAMKLLY
jgi:hypothetical protein